MHSRPAHPARRALRQRHIANATSALPDPRTLRTNIRATYGRATGAHHSEGLRWYSDAHNHAIDITAATGLPLTQSAGLLAALSPQTGWADNVRLAHDFARTGHAAHFADALRKAQAIRTLSHPSSVLGGRKVRSFYANILRPRTAGAVTIDRHALQVAAPGTDAKVLERIGTYATLAAAYRSEARQLNLLPHQLQAVTWLAHRASAGADRFDEPRRTGHGPDARSPREAIGF